MITKLTKEQEAKIQEYYNEYLARGLSVSETNSEEVFIHVNKLYELYGIKAPKIIILDSPLQCEILINVFQFLWDMEGTITEQNLNIIFDKLEDKYKTEINFNKQELISLTKDSFKDKITQQKNTTKNKTLSMSYKSTWCYGQFDNYWLCYYSYMTEVLGAKLEEDLLNKFNVFKNISKESNLWYPFEKFCFISRKPTEIHTDSLGRLHNTQGASMSFKDGLSIYNIHGVALESWIVLTPQKITAKHIDKEQNIEKRRVMLDLFGADRYLLDGGFKVIHEDVDSKGKPRRLLKKTLKGDESILRVEVINSSEEKDGSNMSSMVFTEKVKGVKIFYNKYLLPVDPECRPIFPGVYGQEALQKAVEKAESMSREERIEAGLLGNTQELTCHNAVASSFGKYGHEWEKPGQIRQGDVFIEFKDGSNLKPFQES